ncbi:MAG: branched-chain amino acid ABC transporter permease [Mycobacteriales bacterium]|nr:branched-chain amino acid ABC transporter permease [Mycobacteriales bacterium]
MGQVLVLGLISGGIYALFALGVVLLHRGTGVLTFAGGEIGAAGALLAAVLVTQQGLPWVVGAVVAVTFGVVLGCVFQLLVVRFMSDADKVAVSVATVGLALFLLAVEIQVFGEEPQLLKDPVDGGVMLAGVFVTWTQIGGLALAVALGFGLQAVLRRSDFGLGILASAQDPTAVRLVGVPLSRISLTIWGAGAGLAVLASILVAPTVTKFGPGYATELYVVGLAAAVIGGLNSLPGAVVGGVVLGVAEAAAGRYLSEYGIPGLRYAVVLGLLLVALLGRQLLPDLLKRLDAVGRPAPQAREVGA